MIWKDKNHGSIPVVTIKYNCIYIKKKMNIMSSNLKDRSAIYFFFYIVLHINTILFYDDINQFWKKVS